ncbi:ABC transporter permease [Ketogulonicigenium robustum]|uniref:ABC transporter permease n=1 Tax=Ketogulonicigenium robustum TaxID=92947 RepID=A0A1W6NYZ1_9RHOB|nr:ABC transporter permease [Ketogulonicigenium robustum]ARO14373.1 ABC transporter permease [Ketogulonicigenium robustum]
MTDNITRTPTDLAPYQRSVLQRIGQRVLSLQPTTIIAIIILVIALVAAVAPQLFTGQNPLVGTPSERLQKPSAAHWFGTDMLGRDLYARVIYGAVHTLTGAVLAVVVGLILGATLGIIAGASRQWVDDAIMRLTDVMLAIPTLLLSLSVLMLTGFGTINIAIAVGITTIAKFARLIRSDVARVVRSEYVEAAYGSGGTFWRVLWRHVLPNSMNSAISLTALQFGLAILEISTLSFLGFGSPPPTPEWGLLIAEGRNYIATAWWLTTIPGLVVVAVVLSANRLSRALIEGSK